MFSLRSTRIKAALVVFSLMIANGAHGQIDPSQINWPIMNTWLAQAGNNGMACDGTTDDTSAFNSLLATVYSAGGGEIRVNGTCLISGQVTLSNSGGGSPTQPTIRITSIGSSANGLWTTPPATSGTLDLRYNSTSGKILTLGLGRLEIDHLTLIDGGSDCAAFVYTTNTLLAFHDNLVSGTATGVSACNDAVILGGTTASGGGAATNWFQGYGTYISHNFFDKIRRGVYLREAANAVVVSGNTWSASCGATSSEGAVQVGFSGAAQVQANIFSGNLYETTHYPYVYNVWGQNNLFFGDTFWDNTGTLISLFHFQSGASLNNAYISKDSSITEAEVTNDQQPNGSNAVMDQLWQAGAGLAAIQNRLCLDTSGSGTAQTCNTGTPFTPGAGSLLLYHTTTSNSSTSLTINVNGLGAKPVRIAGASGWTGTLSTSPASVPGGSGTVPLIPLAYDGTSWNVLQNGVSSSGSSFTAAGDLSGSSSSQTVIGLKTVPFCTGYTPANGDVIQYTTAGSPNPCYTSTPNGSGAVSSLTTVGSSGAATLIGGVLNVPVYSGGGSSGMPFAVLQETIGNSATGTSFTLTYPQAAAASGATEWLIVATGGTTITTPSGWTLDVDYNPAYHVALYHRTSASDTSVTIAVGASTQIGVYYVELVGSRSLDTSTTFNNLPVSSGLGAYSIPMSGSITPSAGAWVISASCTSPPNSISSPPVIPRSDSLWTIRANQTGAVNYKMLILETANFSATAASTTPPAPNMLAGSVDTGNNAATILFSIK